MKCKLKYCFIAFLIIDVKKLVLFLCSTTKSYQMRPGPSFTTSVIKQDTDLTPEMLSSGSWKEKTFKPYNLKALGVPIARGHLHPLMKVRTEFRQIFLEMGYVQDLKLFHYKNLFVIRVCVYTSIVFRKCRPTISLKALFGISTPCSNLSNIQPEMRTTLFSFPVC